MNHVPRRDTVGFDGVGVDPEDRSEGGGRKEGQLLLVASFPR